MTRLFITEIKPAADPNSMDTIKAYFSDELVNRLTKSPGAGHWLKRVTSRLMLVQIFKELELDVTLLRGLHYNRHGKLVMDTGTPNISISYSNSIVACVVSEHKIGVDIEDISEPPASKTMTLLEKWTGRKVKDQMDFFMLWTQIESIAKLYDDKGLADIFYGNLLSEKHYTRQYLLNNNYLVSMSALTCLDTAGQIKTLTI
ncbi:4'-phosphopantetheinyl transferase family protein [Chitinophaga sancti]|uniref:4'-phosphopantetheinyl transferase superfamily protein n=1 Tax=Chitinophaga sancti TaxID=1004 RepID=A0A1K1RJR8_9BACT|nr:hypothetical protein [Chitinophaga sancti]WQD60786.1 hypothetical protein U0033_23080 [Chitinophaga sancti]WQG87086.1 hypothetical protein SR876_19390 [Chitinophaga sancti]SFW72506.1 hypothetical protein SAMN05661012_03947 [Chitinophaga sancti]